MAGGGIMTCTPKCDCLSTLFDLEFKLKEANDLLDSYRELAADDLSRIERLLRDNYELEYRLRNA
jgi:hypothetical protein